MKIRREIKIGIYLIVVVICFIIGINYIKGKDLFHRHRTFYARYDNVTGLVEAAPVSINGFSIGKVNHIYFESAISSKVIVEITVYNPLNIPKNSVARIFSPDILGTKNLKISLGDSPFMAKDGDTLISGTSASLTEEMSQQVEPLKRKAEALMLSVDTVINMISVIFNDKTRDNLAMSFIHIRQTLENLEHTTYNLDTLVYGQRSRMERILFNVESISGNLRENNAKISNILTNFSTLSDTLAKARIGQTLGDVHNAVMSFSDLIGKINQGKGSVGELVNDDKLYKNLEKSSDELNQLIQDIRVNPHRYLNFSVFPPSGKRMQISNPVKK